MARDDYFELTAQFELQIMTIRLQFFRIQVPLFPYRVCVILVLFAMIDILHQENSVLWEIAFQVLYCTNWPFPGTHTAQARAQALYTATLHP